MLNKIKSEVKRAFGIMGTFLMLWCIMDNKGIDHYLLEDYILEGEFWLILAILVMLPLAYKMVEYIIGILGAEFKRNIEQIKTELKKDKVQA